MKIKEIIIEKLFDTFDHTISLNNQEGITLMLGENGFGKTVILEMINALFNQDFFHFQSIVFNRFKIKFEDHKVWEVVKSDNEITLRLFENNVLKKPVFKFENDHVLPKWFTERVEQIKIRLVDTQRLLVIAESLPTTYQPIASVEHTNHFKTEKLVIKKTQQFSQEATISIYANELAEDIKSHFAKSMELATKLDSTYPSRLAKNRHQYENISVKQLRVELQHLAEKRQLLHSVGLLEQNTDFLDDESTDKFMIPVLMVYIDDSKQKLQKFDNLAQKLQCFLGIINNRFLYKVMSIDKQQGFIFTSSITGKQIPTTGLSSGEQHELVLFYELLFKTQENSLILIDEPEISLHISWLNQFIEDLKEVIKWGKMDILIATHSPDIISNHWDLTVELEGYKFISFHSKLGKATHSS